MAAHRGGAALWPENSLLAFGRAIALGVPLLELDVHLARDGGVVVIHDRTLERTTDGTGRVADRTTNELRALRLKDASGTLTAERLPTLDDVLALAAPAGVSLLLEVKGPGPSVLYERDGRTLRPVPGPRYEDLEPRLLERLEATGMTARTTLMAFNPDVIREVRRLAPRLRTTFLFGADHLRLPQASALEMLDLAVALGAPDVGLEHTLADAAVVAGARDRGLAVGVWTVNDPASMRSCAGLGVDILTTDRPDLAVELFGTRAGSTA